MTAIATASGRIYDYLNPDPGQILLGDIAMGLASAPRYAGQTERTYSVLMHSLLVAELAPPEHRLHALLHDAPEAYHCDVTSPDKQAMRQIARADGRMWSDYDIIELRSWKAICTHFGIPQEIPDAVHQADQLAMLVEAPVLQPKGWACSVWDFARAGAEIARDHTHRLRRLMAEGESQCAATYLMAVTDELVKLRQAA